MEYVEGTPITAYCDAHQLPIAERIELFQTVAEAVQHAHQNLVVHRDLKPSNILVTDDGRVKLLDFGIAKLLEPDAAADPARTRTRWMTPHYAAPEQFECEHRPRDADDDADGTEDEQENESDDEAEEGGDPIQLLRILRLIEERIQIGRYNIAKT